MKKKVDPLTAADPVSRALADYQAQQDSMNSVSVSGQMESLTNMARGGPTLSEGTTSSGPLRHVQNTHPTARPPQYGGQASGEMSNDSKSASSGPPHPPYPHSYTNRDKDAKRNGKIMPVIKKENLGSGLSGQERPENSHPLQDISSHSLGQSRGFSGWTSGQPLGYNGGYSGAPTLATTTQSHPLTSQALHSLQESGPLSTIELTRIPSFSTSFPLVCPAPSSSQGYSTTSLSNFSSFYPPNSLSQSEVHANASHNSGCAATGGDILAMMGQMLQPFESREDCYLDQNDQEAPTGTDSAASAPGELQQEEVREPEVGEYQDDLFRQANEAVNEYHMQSPMMTVADLADRGGLEGPLDVEDGLFYEPPRLPVDSPFMSYDLVSSSLQAYSPLGVRRMIMPSGSCMTPPTFLIQSPFEGNSPQSKLRNAARSFSGSPSILRKRPRQIMIPSKIGSTGEKLDARFKEAQTTTSDSAANAETSGGLPPAPQEKPAGASEFNSNDASSKPAVLQACQARTALFMSPPYKLGKLSNKVLNPENPRSKAWMDSNNQSQECATDSSGGGGGSSSFSGRDDKQGGACGSAPRENAGGKFNKRGRSHGSNQEYNTRTRRDLGVQPLKVMDSGFLTRYSRGYSYHCRSAVYVY